MKKTASQRLREAMEPGRVYRRHELARHSSSLTRDLSKLVRQGYVVHAAAGLYYRPKLTGVGPAPASSEELVRAFLNDGKFLFISFNEYNLLSLGLTQLYNQQFVYNQKRYGEFVLDGRRFTFRRPRDFPSELTKEYLFVDLFNNKDEFSGNTEELKKLLALKVKEANSEELSKAAQEYGKVATRKFFEEVLAA